MINRDYLYCPQSFYVACKASVLIWIHERRSTTLPILVLFLVFTLCFPAYFCISLSSPPVCYLFFQFSISSFRFPIFVHSTSPIVSHTSRSGLFRASLTSAYSLAALIRLYPNDCLTKTPVLSLSAFLFLLVFCENLL